MSMESMEPTRDPRREIVPGIKIRVLVSPLFPQIGVTAIVSAKDYSSLGKPLWGATFLYETMVINPDFDKGIPGAPEEIPSMEESSPQWAERFSFNEQDQIWECRIS